MFYYILFGLLVAIVVWLARLAARAHLRSVHRNDGRFSSAPLDTPTYSERLRDEISKARASDPEPAAAVVIPFPSSAPDLGSIYNGIGAEESRWEGGGGSSGGAGASASWDAEPSRPDFSNVTGGSSSTESSSDSSSSSSGD